MPQPNKSAPGGKGRPSRLAIYERLRVQIDELRERLGANALARARTFTWERTAATTLAVVQRQAAVAASRSRRLPRA